jgi:hypothetical protein
MQSGRIGCDHHGTRLSLIAAGQVRRSRSRRRRHKQTLSRWKRAAIGESLRFRTEDRRSTEIAFAVRILNRMVNLGRPDSVRVA